MTKPINHYDNLKVTRDAPEAVIRAAYKALMQLYHPDNYLGREDESVRLVNHLRVSYDLLMDADSRSKYDSWLVTQKKLRIQVAKQKNVERATDYEQAMQVFKTNPVLAQTEVVAQAVQEKPQLNKKLNFFCLPNFSLNLNFAIAGLMLLILIFSISNLRIMQQILPMQWSSALFRQTVKL